MKKHKEITEEYFDFKFELRDSESVSITIPRDTLMSIEQVAASRDMSVQALLKYYIGQGLRQDLARYFGDRLLETTGTVLAKHIESQEEISTILHEIRTEALR